MGTVLNFFRDGLANVLTGRGTSVDRQAHNFWVAPTWTDQQVAAAYRASWLHRKIVDIPASDMTRAGRDWDATDDEIAKIETEERRLGYWPKLRHALTLGRLGGGAVFIGLGDDPAQPLPASIRPQQIQYLTVFSRWQLSLDEMEMDPVSPLFGQPRFFRLAGSDAGQVPIHPSRMICFHGLPVPAITTSAWQDRFWGDSVPQAVDEAVQQATSASGGFASLIDEAKIDIFKFSQLVEQLSQPGGEAKVLQRTEMTQQGKSIHRAVILDKDDDWEQRQVTWNGMRDVIITYDGRVAGAADIPATRLFGKAPDGMNATGEGDFANYFQGIGAKQEMDLRPVMEMLDAVVLPSAGVKPDLSWQFSPLMVLTEQQQAEIENKEADSLAKLVNTSLFPDSALAEAFANRMTESQRWPGFKEARDKAIAAGEMDEPDVDPSEIVPVVDPKRAEVVPFRRAANDARFADATPRTLYVRRDVVNVAELKAWAKEQGLPELQDGLHVTIIHSDAPFDWMKIDSGWEGDEKGRVTIPPGGVRIVEPLGDRTAVLLFTSSSLSWRHESMVRAGAKHGFDSYQPHISLTGEPVDLSVVKPYRGKIVLGPEIFEEVDEGRS